MNVYIVVCSNDEETEKDILMCFSSYKNAEEFCSECNEMFKELGKSYYIIARYISDYDRQK